MVPKKTGLASQGKKIARPKGDLRNITLIPKPTHANYKERLYNAHRAKVKFRPQFRFKKIYEFVHQAIRAPCHLKMRIIVLPVTLEEFLLLERLHRKRKKDYVAHLENLCKKFENPKYPVVHTSLSIRDKKGKVLVSYLAQSCGESGFYMGIPSVIMDEIFKNTQDLMASSPIGQRSHVGDSRHEDSGATFEFPLETLSPLGNGIKFKEVEGVGLFHLGLWHPQGQIKKPPVRSADSVGNGCSRRLTKADNFTYKLEHIQCYMKAALRSADQRDHDQKMEAFKAGTFHADLKGPYLMTAILYKLQVGLHNDAKDFGLSAMTCAGRFTGGNLQIPQLGLNLSYRPGDIVLIRASDLFHKVCKWLPVPKTPGDETNPGRSSYVFFSHTTVMDYLKEKPEGWLRRNGEDNNVVKQEEDVTA